MKRPSRQRAKEGHGAHAVREVRRLVLEEVFHGKEAPGLSGALEDGWLPEAATAMGHLMGCGTSREAQSTAQALGRLPYSRSSFERVGHAVGAWYGSPRPCR